MSESSRRGEDLRRLSFLLAPTKIWHMNFFKLAKPKAEDLVPMDTFSGAAADYLGAPTWGGRRAGRSTAMSHAMGKDPGMNVEHPLSTEFLTSIPAAAAGAYAGNQWGDKVGLTPQQGTLAGAGAAGLLAVLLTRAMRRSKMKDINTDFDNASKIKPKRPGFGAGSMLASLGGGSHRSGQIEALKAMTGQDPEMSSTGDTVRAVAGPFGLPGLAIDAGGSAVQTSGAMDEEKTNKRISALPVAK